MTRRFRAYGCGVEDDFAGVTYEVRAPIFGHEAGRYGRLAHEIVASPADSPVIIRNIAY